MPKKRGEMGGPVEQTFGKILRQMRLERGWSQERLADLCSCDRGYIGLLERGVNSPTLSMIFQLAATLGVPASELLVAVETALAAPPLDSKPGQL